MHPLRDRLAQLETEIADPGERLCRCQQLLDPVYQYRPLPAEDDECPPFDLRAHQETWEDVLRLETAGVYPAAFTAITTPVLMLHGDYDPHPGPMIRDTLRAVIPQLTYHAWPHCGHSPWREAEVRDDFFAVLRAWLQRNVPPATM